MPDRRSIAMTCCSLPLLALLTSAGCSGARHLATDPNAPMTPTRTEDGYAYRARTTPTPDPTGSFQYSHHAVQFEGVETPPAQDETTLNNARHLNLVDIYGDMEMGNRGGARRPMDATGNFRMITSATDGACFQPAIDRQGEHVAFASTQHRETSDIYIKRVGGATHRQLTHDPADDMMPTFSPDGSMVAFTSNRHGNWNIFVMPTDGGPPRQITNDADDEIHPSFSPDGRQLVYCRHASRSGRWELWLVDLDSTGQQFLGYGLFPEWSPAPAPNRIVYQRARQRGSRLFSVWTLDIVNGEAIHETEIVSAANAATMHPTWSPDGRRIAFVTVVQPDEQGEVPRQADVYVIDRDGTGRINLTNGQTLNLFPTWSAKGSVFFASDRAGNLNVFALETGRTTQLGGFETVSVPE